MAILCNKKFVFLGEKSVYTTTWKISAIWLAWSSGISAYFEIPMCENFKPFAGSSINKE